MVAASGSSLRRTTAYYASWWPIRGLVSRRWNLESATVSGYRTSARAWRLCTAVARGLAFLATPRTASSQPLTCRCVSIGAALLPVNANRYCRLPQIHIPSARPRDRYVRPITRGTFNRWSVRAWLGIQAADAAIRTDVQVLSGLTWRRVGYTVLVAAGFALWT